MTEKVSSESKSGDADRAAIDSWVSTVRRSKADYEARTSGGDALGQDVAQALLDATFEALGTAEEELRSQNETLIAAQSEIESERAWYRALFDHAPVPYVVTDAAGVIRAANAASAAWLGVERAFLVGKPVVSFVPEDARPSFRRALFHAVEEAAPTTITVPIQPRSGRARVATAAVSVARDRAGAPAEVRWLLHDETARAVERANELKMDLIARVSHELRTPLSAIAGYADLLLLGAQGDLTEAQSKSIERISHAERHMLRLLEDLLTFFRLGASRLPVDLRTVHISDVVDQARTLVEPQAAAAGVTVSVAAAADCTTFADPERMRQILLNLLSNALRHSPPGSGVMVLWWALRDNAVIAVRDSGPGIAAHDLERIFEPFVRLEDHASGAPTGFGLGLAISRELARAMGGDVTVESAPGNGATFMLRLPLRE